MASSDNVASIEPWMMIRPPVNDSWLAEFFARDADALTKALHKSLSGSVLPEDDNNVSSPFLPKPDAAAAAATPTVSSLSGSDQDSAPPRRRAGPPPSGKISKRKSRASKRSQTTFITADPANFRQMVQQVTGVRFGGATASIAPAVVKPEPQRASGLGRFTAGAGCLPTLDTSAFLLDHHHQVVGPASVNSGTVNGLSGPGPLPFAPPLLDASFGPAGLDFDSFSSFPTLESWKVM